MYEHVDIIQNKNMIIKVLFKAVINMESMWRNFWVSRN